VIVVELHGAMQRDRRLRGDAKCYEQGSCAKAARERADE
jgi:hypothetical protein